MFKQTTFSETTLFAYFFVRKGSEVQALKKTMMMKIKTILKSP